MKALSKRPKRISDGTARKSRKTELTEAQPAKHDRDHDAALDEALEETFPASDPISLHIEK